MLYNYTNVWLTPTATTLTFGAMASSDVHLVLSSIPGDQETDVYEVVIGGSQNMRTFIRDEYKAGSTVLYYLLNLCIDIMREICRIESFALSVLISMKETSNEIHIRNYEIKYTRGPDITLASLFNALFLLFYACILDE